MSTTRFGLAAALAATLCVLACASAPPRDPGRPDIVLRTEAHDRKAGEEVSQQIEAEMGLVTEHGINLYVNQVGQRLARYAPRGRFAYRFKIIDQDAPNAFALPGGHIYVSRGLLTLANTEDALANVLAHEIVHVARRHASARQSMINNIPGPFQMFAMGSIASYGRDQEREADRLGQGLAGMAGYDPEAMATFLRNLEYTERLRLGGSRMPHFFDTHPVTSERVAGAGTRARMIAWTPRAPIAGGADGYLRRIDGIVVGISASEGVFQGDRYLHPDIGISLRFPPGWETKNTHTAVGAISMAQRAQVYLELQGKGDDPQKAADEFIEESRSKGLSVDTIAPIKIGPYSAFRAQGRASSPMAPIVVHLTWIARDGMIYRLTGVTIGRSEDRLEGVFRSVARSFRPLTPAQRASVREQRLQLVPARSGESIAALTQRSGNAWDIQRTAVMNGVFAIQSLAAGQLVKIAISKPYQAQAVEAE